MPKILIFAIVFISLALVFYTVGVFGEKRRGTLTVFHTILFWCGFVCDTTGTMLMGKIAKANAETVNNFSANLHSITGALALLLMIFHAIWATIIIIKKDDRAKAIFHRFSIVVWAIWLIPYGIGMFIGMAH